MAISRVTAEWTGFPGAPGYSNFYFGGDSGTTGDAQADADRVQALFEYVASYLPTGVTVTIQPEVVTLDETTGNMTGITAIESPDTVTGRGTGGFSGPSGAVVNWMTGSFVNGRLVRGRTFFVPLAGSAYESNGTLTTPALNGFRTGASIFVGEVGSRALVVWRRPRNGTPGSSHLVTSAQVPDIAAVLRSRRD